MDVEQYLNYAWAYVMQHGPMLILAIITLFIGFKIIKRMLSLLDKAMSKKEMDESLQKFLHSLFAILFKTLLILSVISMVGVDTTSFIAILASAGFAIGMALQGSLGNFAGGVLILVFRPYKVGDVIEAQGFIGKVEEIQVFNTILKTPDNKTIFIPNGPMSSGPITNYTLEKIRRVDLVFGIGYDDDIKKAKEIIETVAKSNEKVLKDPEYTIAVGELADSSVNIICRVWANTEDYWDVYFSMQENMKLEFDKNGISIPFPQQDVHMHNVN